RARARDRGHRQPALSPGRPDPRGLAPAAAGLGGRDWLLELGTAPAEVHRLASRRALRDPGHWPGRSSAGEHGRGRRGHARPRDAQANRRSGRRSLMSDWWTYRLSDFLLFSPDTYRRLFELYNAGIWPIQMAAALLGLLALAAALRRSPREAAVLAILALCWAWVGWAFHLGHYQTINW